MNETKVIPLKGGGEALVSPEDFHWLSQRDWYRDDRGYAACGLFRRREGMIVKMHRLILLAPNTATVDHANGNTLDNRRENLRLATQSQQNANRLKFKGRSQFKGVYRRCDGLKWVAHIKNAGRPKNLGSFVSEDDAARAYDAAARQIFGEFACLNFPGPGERGALADRCRSHRPD